MKISFDLDDTLIPGNYLEFITENRNFFQKIFKIESLRKGTKELIKDLKSKENVIGIYTTSFRPKYKIKFQFLTYGIKLDFIINEKENRKELKRRNLNCSKYPPAFDIDIHIDDSKGVELEGQKHNFETIILGNTSKNWIKKIKEYKTL